MMMTQNTYATRLRHACFISLAAVVLFACGGKHKEKEENEESAAPEAAVIETFAVQKGFLSSFLHVPGELVAFQKVDLYAKENSFVKKLYADVGTEVSTGQLLVTMEAPEIESQIAGALSNIKSREAIYIASKANYDRLYETSKTPGTISPNDLEQAAAKRNSDLAQLDAAKAMHKQITEMQNYLQIRAPFNGVITARNVNLGAYVGPSGKGSELPLFTLQEQKKLRLVFSVPEAYSNNLSQKNSVNFTVTSVPGKQFSAKISRLAGALDDRLNSQRVEMDVINDKKQLLPGMVAEVNLQLPSQDSIFIVPKSAVVNSTESVFVIRVNNNKAEWVPAKTGREADGKIEVYANLQNGDVLVKTATDEIRNGSELKKVKLVGIK